VKKPQTLRRYVLKVQSVIALIIVLSYTLVINFYFIHGLDEANFQDLHLESNQFAALYQENNDISPPNSIHFQGYIGWENLPHWAKENFSSFEFVAETTMENTRIMAEGNLIPWPEQVVFIIAQPLFDGKVFYLLRNINTEKYDALSQMGIKKMLHLTWPIALIFLLIMHFSVQILLRRTLKPFYQIGDWVGSLTLKNVNEVMPDFEFTELNAIANQQQKTLLRLSNILDKEQSFLRHASHELRTPIAVVKSNSELLTRILSSDVNEDKKAQSLARISRAALNMQHTTETLLWLSQDSDIEDNTNNKTVLVHVDLNEMIKNLVEDNQYLLQSKNVNVSLDLTPVSVEVLETPCRLVLNNLIRNAFQYTAEGNVNIQCLNGIVKVENINQSDGAIDHSGADYGYGFGLRLVDKIIKKMLWQYQNKEIVGGRWAMVDFNNRF